MIRNIRVVQLAAILAALLPVSSLAGTRTADTGSSGSRTSNTPQTVLPVAPVTPGWVRATPEERAMALRADPLSQAAFFSNQYEHDPGDTDAGVQLSNALRTLGRYGEAGEVAHRVLMIAPDNPAALFAAARAHLASGDQAFYAIEPLKRLTELQPRGWQAWSLLGVAYDQTKRPVDAWAAWNTALRFAPNQPDVLTNMAMFKAGNGDLEGAETLLRTAVSQTGSGMKTRQNLALVLGLQGKMTEAERLLREDLPPDQADHNLQWLKSNIAGSSTASVGASGRTWESLGGGN